MPRTVLFYSDSLEFGGAEGVLVSLLEGLDRRSWSPVLYYHETGGIAPLVCQAQELCIPVRAVEPMPLGLKGARQSRLFANEIRRLKPSVFHANLTWPLSGKYGLVAALLARVPVVLASLHTYVEIPYSAVTVGQLRLIVRLIDRYITVSHDLASRIRRTFGFPGEKIQVIHNGVHAERYAPQPVDPKMRLQFAGNLSRPVVLTTARLEKMKGLSYLLEAAVLVPEAMFLLAGEGPLRGELESLAGEFGISDRVVFLGFRQDVGELLASCDFLVLPSLFEGLPLSILEAMAAGKAVVASQTGGNGEAVIHEETGLLVPPGDPERLASAIRRLITEPGLSRRFGDAGRSRLLREFTAGRMVEQYHATYQALLQSKGAADGG
jgi:glycosyltransferase involved in cell wall biosynthesis